MPVSTTHPQYDANLEYWQKTRAATSGKKKQLNKFLRTVDKNDPERQAAYESGAIYQNWTGRTKNALLGAVFRKDATIDVPPGIASIIEKADKYGNTLDQVVRSIVSEVLEVGRHGILVDYPDAEAGLTAAQVRAMKLAPTFSEYAAECIINWRDDGGRLVLVVLAEDENVATDKFDYEFERRYRVLEIDESGYYVQTLYDDGGVPIDQKEPRMANGQRWKEIPFIIPGSVNNDINVDDIPMLPLAELGIGAYQNSADYEEGVFICGQPMLHIDTGQTTDDAFHKQNPNGVKFGSRRATVTQGGSVELVQAAANSTAFEAMNNKSDQAVKIGARLIESSGSNQTAAAARIDAASEHSTLDLIVSNCSDAIRKCLQWACLMTGDNPDLVEYDLNRDFFDESVDPQMIMAAIQLHDRRALSRQSLVYYSKRAGIAPDDKSVDELIDDIDSEGPAL